MKTITVENCRQLKIVTDKEGNEYVLQGFVVGDDYLIPYDGSSYWEHHFVPKSTWLPIETIDFNQFDITLDEYNEIKTKSKEKYKEILHKYHTSF